MNDTRSQIIVASFAWIPYALVAWACAAIDIAGFWEVLAFLLAARLFFAIIETLGGVLAWRSYGRRRVIERNLAVLRAHSFPPRQVGHDDFLNYLARIEDDDHAPESLRATAKQWSQMLEFFENTGMLVGMRMHSAADAALNIYSPAPRASDAVRGAA